MLISMDNFKKNQCGIIKYLISDEELITQRIREVGIIPGSKFVVLGTSFFGNDPIMIDINNCIIAIRKNEAKQIMCELIK